MIYDLLSGWFGAFTSHVTALMEKLNLIETDTASIKNSASDIKSNTDDIKDNTGAIVTPVLSIKTNTDSIKTDTTSIKNNVTTMSNQLGTISTNVGTASAFTEDVANNTLDIKDKVVTIASDTTQIRSNTNTVVTDMSKVYEALKWALIDKVTTETEEGVDSISFDTDLTNNLVSLVVDVKYTQSGTGDPSPSNVRPITGVIDKSITVNGNNVTIALGRTVYKAILDVLSGKLKIISAFVTFDGTQSNSDFAFSSGINKNRIAWNPFQSIGKIGSLSFVSDKLTSSDTYTGTPDIWHISNSAVTVARCFIGVPTTITSVSDWQNYVSNNNISIIYELNTPIEVQLTPSQIATIKGIVTIITDGNIRVTYEESVKHYLDKQEA